MVISLASAKGGHAQEILKSPSWTTGIPCGRFQENNLNGRDFHQRVRISSWRDSRRNVSQLPSSAPSTSAVEIAYSSAFVLGGQSAQEQSVNVTSNKFSRISGRSGRLEKSPCAGGKKS